MKLCTHVKYEKSLGTLNCSICFTEFKKHSHIYVSKENFGYVCENCFEKFSVEDIEHFISLFNKYGGFFGKFRNDKITVTDLVKEFFELLSIKSNIDIMEANMKLRHKALVHGYLPQQLVEKMKELIP